MKDDRLISLNAAIHVIKDALLSWSNMPEWRENKIVGALDKLPSAQRWIPCSERLPEDGRVVLWCNEHGSVFTTAITARFDNSWAVGKRHRSSRMVAWMPLPDPYKEPADD